MTADEMSNRILEYIGRNGDASFANLMNMFGEDAKGELALEILPNVFLWANVSRALIDALAAVKHLLEVKPTTVMGCATWKWEIYGNTGQSTES
jgi:hypothetical protein